MRQTRITSDDTCTNAPVPSVPPLLAAPPVAAASGSTCEASKRMLVTMSGTPHSDDSSKKARKGAAHEQLGSACKGRSRAWRRAKY